MRFSLHISFAVLASLISFAGPSSVIAAAAPTLVLTKQTFTDPKSGNMPSHTMFIPQGWKTEGGAFWAAPQMFRIHPSQLIKVAAPDGRLVVVGPTLGAYDFLPSQMAQQQLGARRPQEMAIQNGTPVLHLPKTLKAWGDWIGEKAIKAGYPKATNVKIDPVETIGPLTKLLHQQLAPIMRQQNQQNQFAAQNGDPSRVWCNGAVMAARATYDLDGKSYEHVWVWSFTVIGTDAQVGREMLWSIEPSVSFRAPLGKLKAEMPLLMTIANSVRMTRKWATMKATHLAKMQKIDNDAFVARAVQHAQFSNEMRAIIAKTGRNQAAASDRSQDQFIKSIHEVSDFSMPNNGPTVTLPIHYKHYYTDGETIVLTNDANSNAVQGMRTLSPATSRP